MRIKHGMIALMLSVTALSSTAALTGCAGGAIVFDPYQQDYHRWNGYEDHYYREWEIATNRRHMDFYRRSPGEVRAYWEYRHK